jgi:transposase-like protein
MKTNKSERAFYPEEDKRFYILLLTKPQKSGKPKTVQEVSDQYAVNPKSLYEWLKLSRREGDQAFNKNRGPSNSKSKNQELQEEIFKIALLNPMFNAKKIIESLPLVHRRITAPTVQKILKTRDLNTMRKRSIATEYAHVKQGLAITKSTLDYLIKKNPYFDLFQINRNIEGSLFYLKCFDLSDMFEKGAGYLLLAVDTKSLTTFSQIWNGKYLDVPITFINELSKIFGKYGVINYFETEDNEIFRELKNTKPTNQINWFDSGKYYFSPDRFEIALSEALNLIQIKFLETYTFASVEKLQADLEGFLLMHRTTDGPLGYPAFGKSPYHLTKK